MSATPTNARSIDDIIGVNNTVTDSSIITGLWFSATLGVAVIILFCTLQRHSQLYKHRLVADCVRVKPPKLRDQGFYAYVDWAIKAITISDVDFIQSAGLDALIMVKLCALGVQLFLPTCILGIIILIPLHLTGGASKKTTANVTGFMRLTMSNIIAGSPVFWVHLLFIYLYMAWALVLLRWHYHQYLTIRQHYLRKGDDVNMWRALYEQHPGQVGRTQGVDLRSFLRNVPLIKALIPSGVPISPGSSEGMRHVKDSDDEDEGDRPSILQSGLVGTFPSLGDVPQRLTPPGGFSRLRSRRMTSIAERSAFRGLDFQDGHARQGHAHGSAYTSQTQLARRSVPPVNEAVGDDGKPSLLGGRSDRMGGSLHTTGSRTMQRGGSAVHMDAQLALRNHSRPHSHTQRPATTLATVGSGELEPAVGNSNGASGGHDVQPVGSSAAGASQAAAKPAGSDLSSALSTRVPRSSAEGRSVGNGGGGAGAVAEATEGPSGANNSDPTSAAGPPAPAAADPVAAAPAGHDNGQRGVSPAPPLEVVGDPAVVLLVSSVDGNGMGADGLGRGSTARQHGVNAMVPSDTDVEAGHGANSPSILDDTPPDCPAMSRPEWIDPGAHLLEWWQDPRAALRRRRDQPGAEGTPRGGTKGSSQEHGKASGEDPDELVVSRSRPSVSHRKTVNALYWDGRRRAVLAQHYAVLVTDVVEYKAPEGKADATKEDAKSEAQPTEDKPTPKRLASFLPRCLRSWCNMQYGSQAARHLNDDLASRSSSRESLAASAYPPARYHTPTRMSVAHSRGSYGQPLARKGSADPSLRPHNASSPVPGHRRTRSTGDALRAQGIGGIDPASVNLVTQAAGQHGAAELGDTRGQSLRSAAGPGSNGEQIFRVFELMAGQALEARENSLGLVCQDGCMQEVPRSHTTRDKDKGAAGRAGSGVLDIAGEELPADVRAASESALAAPLQKREVLSSRLGGRDATGVNSGGQPGGGDGVRHAHSTGRLGAVPPSGLPPLPPLSAAVYGPARSGPGPVAEAAELSRGSSGTGGAAGAAEPGDGQPTLVSPTASADPGAGSTIRRRRASPDADGSSGGGTPGDDGGAEEGSSTCTRATLYWALVREAVWDGRVAMLPCRSRYSVVTSTFMRLFPGEFDRAIPVINHKQVDLLLMRIDQHMAQYEFAKQYEEKTSKQLVRRIGCCGLFGERKRLREYHREQVNKLMSQVDGARRRAFEQAHTASWFVFFRTQQAAAMASQCVIHAEDNRQFRVHPAPGPEEVNWSTLWSDFRSRDLRRNLMRPLVCLVVIFPIGIFTGGLMQLDYLLCPKHACRGLEMDSAQWIAADCSLESVARGRHQLRWDWYCNQEDVISKALKTLVVGWLPSLLITLWQGMILPLVFTFTVQASRQARSLSEVDRTIAKNMFYFGVFNVFLGGVLGSAIIQGINTAIEQGPSKIFDLIGTYLPTSSNFFINYTMFRALVAVPLRMLWPHIGIRLYLIRRYLRISRIMTEREKAVLMAPVSPRYGFEVGMVMLMFIIAFAYSVVSPVLLPFALLFFAISWLFWRWALLYVYVRKYEGGGTMWPFIFSRVLVCIGILPTFTGCVLIAKHAYAQAIILFITVPIVLVRFNWYCYYRFQSGIRALPLEATVSAPQARIEPWVYMPPPLLSNLAGWNPDWSKAWQGWNMPVVYG